MSKEQPGPKPWVSQILIPIGSVLIAALALIGQYPQLPRWVVLVAVSYLAVVVAVSLYVPVTALVSIVLSKRRSWLLAETYSPRLLEGVGGLRHLLTREQTNTLLYVLGEASQWDELRGRSPIFDPEHVETMRDWLHSIETRARRYKRDDFPNFCRELASLISQYNRFCCQRHRQLQEMVAGGVLPEQRSRQLRQKWNVHREGHMAFMRQWENLSRAINERAGTRICLDYYEPIGTLE